MLVEFLPKNPSLLGININGGAAIKVRLRPNNDPSRFLDYDDVLGAGSRHIVTSHLTSSSGTLLHELAHIVRAPHDTLFYSTLKTLEGYSVHSICIISPHTFAEECSFLIFKGIHRAAPASFTGHGHTLTTAASVPRHRAREAAAACVHDLQVALSDWLLAQCS